MEKIRGRIWVEKEDLGELNVLLLKKWKKR
jgi:hypothetical protein